MENFGGRSRTRTYGPLIKSQLLCQLSYAPAQSEGGRYGITGGNARLAAVKFGAALRGFETGARLVDQGVAIDFIGAR